jgi:hypothetical protein
MEVYLFPCRRPGCNKPARENTACCSQLCREAVPNCNIKDCNNAVEYSIYKGIDMPGNRCYKHGGRIMYDGDPSGVIRKKRKCVMTGHGPKWAK